MWAKRSEMLAPLRPSGRMWRDEDHPQKQGEKETLALGFNSSNSIWQCQKDHHQRGGTGLSRFHKPFDIYTDASTKQLGVVITQDNRPIAFFSRKLSGQKSKYTITKLELLAIVETLKEFKGM